MLIGFCYVYMLLMECLSEDELWKEYVLNEGNIMLLFVVVLLCMKWCCKGVGVNNV